MNTYQVPVSVIGFRAVEINILFPATQTHSTARRQAQIWAAKCQCDECYTGHHKMWWEHRWEDPQSTGKIIGRDGRTRCLLHVENLRKGFRGHRNVREHAGILPCFSHPSLQISRGKIHLYFVFKSFSTLKCEPTKFRDS